MIEAGDHIGGFIGALVSAPGKTCHEQKEHGHEIHLRMDSRNNYLPDHRKVTYSLYALVFSPVKLEQ